jgi:hypothetical protein
MLLRFNFFKVFYTFDVVQGKDVVVWIMIFSWFLGVHHTPVRMKNSLFTLKQHSSPTVPVYSDFFLFLPNLLMEGISLLVSVFCLKIYVSHFVSVTNNCSESFILHCRKSWFTFITKQFMGGGGLCGSCEIILNI